MAPRHRPNNGKRAKAPDPSLFDEGSTAPAETSPIADAPTPLKKTRARSTAKRPRKIRRPIADVDKMFAACLARLNEIETWLATPDATHINRALRLWKSFVDDASHLLEATASIGSPPPALVPIRVHKPPRRR
jgi:hypothetical protein